MIVVYVFFLMQALIYCVFELKKYDLDSFFDRNFNHEKQRDNSLAEEVHKNIDIKSLSVNSENKNLFDTAEKVILYFH